MKLSGRVSSFGGPEDMGVSPSEGLAIYEPEQIDEAPDGMFLEEQPAGTTGLARRLNPDFPYIATRWDYDVTSKDQLRGTRVLVRSPDTGKFAIAWPCDWGPHEETDRVADISPGLMDTLGIETDDEVQVVYFTGEEPSAERRLSVVISSGHGKHISGAVGYINEHDEAVKVVDAVAAVLSQIDVDVKTFEDTTSHDQDTNLETIVDFHNSQGPHDYDISIHFNASVETDEPVGTECWYMTQEVLADEVAAAISAYGELKPRGPKFSDDLYFLKHTHAPAILIEVCFVDSSADAEAYNKNFETIAMAIAGTIART